MLAMFARAMDRFRGSGEAAVTIPPMDGALRPNFHIENAPLLAAATQPDNLTLVDSQIVFSSGSRLLELNGTGAAPRERAILPSEITALASHDSGSLIVGLVQGGLVLSGGPHDGKMLTSLGNRPITCATAAVFADANTVLVSIGSDRHSATEWKRDLMSNGSTGSIWRIDLASMTAERVAAGLAFPYGVALDIRNRIIVSESWKHRVVALKGGSKPEILYEDIPGYPARITRDVGKEGFLLTVFAPRLQLIEFVLREDEYRRRMMAEVEQEYWIAPSLHAPVSFLEPLQGGGLKQLGELKPWAPSRSYGLVVRLDGNCQPIESFHSRANGTRHGITSCVSKDGKIIVASKGGDAIVAIER